MCHRTRRVLLLASLAALGSAWRADAQTWISTSGNWSENGRWSAPPTPSPSTLLMFPMYGAGSLAYVSTNDLPGAFTLDDVIIAGTPGGSLLINGGSTASLRFAGASPSIAVAGGGDLTLGQRVDVTGMLTAVPGAAGALRFAGPIHGTSLAVFGNGGGKVVLDSPNRLPGGISGTASSGVPGIVQFGRLEALGTGPIAADGLRLSFGSSTFATAPAAPPYLRNDITIAGGGLVLGDGRSFTVTGSVTGAGPIDVTPTGLSAGTWTLSGTNTVAGTATVRPAPGSTPGVLNMLAFDGPQAVSSGLNFSLMGSGAAIGFVGGVGSYTVSNPLTLSAGGTIAAFGGRERADIVYAGPITGTGGLARVGGGILTLSGNNSYVGGTTLAGGVTVVDTDARLGDAGGSILLSGGKLILQPGFGTTSRGIVAANPAGTLHVSDSVTLNGAMSNGSITPGGIVKSGVGNLTLTNLNNSLGSFTISDGTVTVSGNGRLLTTGSIALQQGAALVLNNATANLARIGTAAPVSLSGSRLHLIGNATLNTSAVSTGVLSLGNNANGGQGVNVITAEPGAGAHALIRFGSIGRTGNNGMHTVFTGAGLGDSPAASLTIGKSNISFTTAPEPTNGILPYAIMDRGAGLELVSYTAANGVIPATYGSSSLDNGGVATFNVSVGSAATPAGGGTINAGKFTGGTVDLAAGTLTVTSGAILFTGPTTITGNPLIIGTTTTSTATAPTANFFVHADTTIGSRVFTYAVNAGLPSGIAKSGPAVLTLSNTATNYNGPTRILEGTLRLGANNIIPNNSVVVINPGATLDMGGFNDTIGGITQVNPIADEGNYATGTLLLGNSTLIAGQGTDGNGVINLNIVGGGTFIKGGQGTLTVSGTQAMSGTVSIGNGQINLATHHTEGTGFSSVGRINLGHPGGAGTLAGEVSLRFDHGLRGYDRPIFVQAATGRTATLAFADDVGATLNSPITLTNNLGVVIDAAGGPTLAGTISGATGPLTTVTTGIGDINSRDYSIRIAGSNTYGGTTTLGARATVWAHPQAFGSNTGPILLGTAGGDDTPELSGDVGGLTLSRQISLQSSLSGVPTYAMISSRVPAGGGTLTYSGAINIPGNRSRLILFSVNEPLSITGAIMGGATAVNPNAKVQIGFNFSEHDVTTRSTVILSGANNYPAGTTLAAGTLGINGNSLVSGVTGALVNSPIGTGTLTIGAGSIAAGHEPTLLAVGAPRTLRNTVNVTRHFVIAGDQPLTLDGSLLLGDSPKVITVDPAAILTVGGLIGGTGNSALVKQGGGPILISRANAYSGSLVVNEGTAVISANQVLGGGAHVGPGATARLLADSSAVLSAGSITVDMTNGGQLDLADRAVIVDYTGATPMAQVAELVAAGHAGGAWTGAGINSSTAAAGSHTGIGLVEASDIGASSLAGQGFIGDAVLLRYTLYGDTDLSLTVDIDDFARMAATFNAPGDWFLGDFDYNGIVDIDDFGRLAANFNQTLPAAVSALAATHVPEPSALLAAAVFTFGRRRRRAVRVSSVAQALSDRFSARSTS